MSLVKSQVFNLQVNSSWVSSHLFSVKSSYSLIKTTSLFISVLCRYKTEYNLNHYCILTIGVWWHSTISAQLLWNLKKQSSSLWEAHPWGPWRYNMLFNSKYIMQHLAVRGFSVVDKPGTFTILSINCAVFQDIYDKKASKWYHDWDCFPW